MQMKTCSICQVSKNLTEFYKETRSKDGYAHNCKKCESKRKKTAEAIKQRKERYKKNRVKIIAQVSEHKKKYWHKYQIKHNEYYQNNKLKWLEAGWKQKGILNEVGEYFKMSDYNRILESQNGLCKICCTDGTKHSKRLMVDHDHNTGIVRGILCGYCNTAISYLKDDVNLLNKAINYLKTTMK